MTLRSVRYMISMVKMRLRKEWVVAVAMIRLISFHLSLEVGVPLDQVDYFYD